MKWNKNQNMEKKQRSRRTVVRRENRRQEEAEEGRCRSKTWSHLEGRAEIREGTLLLPRAAEAC